MVTLLTIVHITVCVFLILVVLLQAGKGGGMGIAFGGAGSQTVFGSSGAGNFLTRLTSITATVFIVTSLALAHYSSRQDSKRLQVLAEKKAAEKKGDDDKAAKLKAEVEKIRAVAAAKDGGVSVTAPGTEAPTVPGTAPALPPIQLKMPGSLNETGTPKPAGDTGAPKPAAPKAAPAAKAAATKPAATPAATSPGGAEGASAPAAGATAEKPAVRRRKPAVAPAATGEVPAAPAPEAPAPAAPAE